MKPAKWVLTYLGPCDIYIDPTSELEWALGDSLVVDRDTKKRVVADIEPNTGVEARWQVERLIEADPESELEPEQAPPLELAPVSPDKVEAPTSEEV